MKFRTLGRTGYDVSAVSFGAWAIGGSWGDVDDRESLAALHAAIDNGVNFIDTADVYGMGRSEKLVAQVKRERREEVYIATKAGRRLPKQLADSYTREKLNSWIDESLRNLTTESIDLLQLHCPPTDLYYKPEVFGYLDDLMQAGKIRSYGVSVERVEEALKAIEFPNVRTVQIVFNCFRLRPTRLFFEQAKAKHVGILARVPLASGLLTGKLRPDTQFQTNDHRQFNRNGEAFDMGETFSGVDYEVALKAVEELRPLVPPGRSMAQFALRWILMFDAVSCAIPGGKRPEQVRENCLAADAEPLTPYAMAAVEQVYKTQIAPLVEARW